MRSAADHRHELERRQRRFQAAQQALSDVPAEVPADAMLDFYSALSEAVKGRLEGANTIARVNDALKDVFDSFLIQSAAGGIYVLPVVEIDGQRLADWVDDDPKNYLVHADAEITPPLRTLHAPSPQLANAQE
jgi:hypothetical protein